MCGWEPLKRRVDLSAYDLLHARIDTDGVFDELGGDTAGRPASVGPGEPDYFRGRDALLPSGSNLLYVFTSRQR